ncbi:MAG: zinc ribbon domain-containing protein [Synechococcales cyanobacterium M58_A2018_015]|nr:zinc ribbon domain-containing protein [Synechococcales cyanobacterium M58_A2018_015]
MPTCPRCHQAVDSQAITCPYCRTALKAYGHPGIPLYRAVEDEYLCQTCTYDEDNTCNFPQRPYAKECTLYHNRLHPPERLRYRLSWQATLRGWLQRHTGLLIVLGLLGVSLVVAMANR